VLAYVLTKSGCKTSELDPKLSEQSDPHQQSDTRINADPSVDDRIDEALAIIEKYKAEGNFMKMMQEGVSKLKAIEAQDSMNERVLYNLGKLSLESGQLELAQLRFKKLILLQPSNEEYQNLFDDVQKRLGEN
jgi:hypothetical protein